MIVITNGTEYIYLDEDHQIQKTTDISKAKQRHLHSRDAVFS